MLRRSVDLLHTTSARLTLLYAGLFGISVSILFGVIYWAATTALRERIDQNLAAERDVVIAGAGSAENRVGEAIAEALRRSHGEFRYLVQDASGTVLAGNLPSQHTWRAGYQDADLAVENAGSNSETHLFRVLGVPLDHRGLLVIAQDAYALEELRELIIRAFGWGAAATLLLAAIGGGIMVSRVMHRVEVINQASERIMAGDLTERLPVRKGVGRGDEFDRLSKNLNRTLDRIEQLVEGLRQVSTDIAHDLRTPLSRLRRTLEAMRSKAYEEGRPEYLTVTDTAVAQVDGLLDTFAGLLRIAQIESRSARFVSTSVDLSEIAGAVMEVYRPAAEEKQQELEGQIPDGVYVAGDRALLTQMVANVVENAIRHAPGGASIQIALRRQCDDGPLLTISDTGPGIPPHEHQNVLRRFYRLDASRGSPGNGLGLPLAAAIAELHGVGLQLSDNTPHGLRVCLSFRR